ncbi:MULTISPECIES: ABC transporter ATP-binding protein [unclassified Duganella]|uniref:ABC transporter ATP-binding protein n=1 Tax=unclassified Duganella TaxID=2636909 RepID=UPI001E6198B5|nr:MULTISPECIES: ABC transporter ATP-binding protein [unclassified Duganella]
MNFQPHLERLRLLYPVRRQVAAAVFFMALGVGVQLLLPKGIAYFIDHVNELNLASISWPVVGLGLGWIAVQVVASTLRYYYFERSGHLIINGIRRRLFDVLINQPVSFFDRHHVGEISSRLSSDVQSLHQALAMGGANALQSLCMFGGGVTMLLTISPALSLMLLVLVPANLYFGKVSGANYRDYAKLVQTSMADSNRVAQEQFTHVRLVHAYNQQAGASASYAEASRRLLEVALAGVRLQSAFRGGLSVLDYGALLASLVLGAWLIGRHALSVGDLMAFVIYSTMVTQAAAALSEFWNMWMRSMGATERIFEIMRTHQPPAASRPQAPPSGQLGFEDVVFSYPERPGVRALDRVGFVIAAGEKVALVGASGAGKSTIAALVLGHYQPLGGRLMFDGVAASELDLAAVRRGIAVVEQEPSLFSGSIAHNIAFAVPERQVSLAEVMAAAKLAHAHEFIQSFPQGYDTLVGEHGVQLSGGQKQRIAIARALLRDPGILILDEATSALDAASELQVQGALDRLMEGRTTIIIAHRFSTIAKADRILVMDQGRVVQQGSHEQLARQQDGAYFKLVKDQMLALRPEAPLPA